MFNTKVFQESQNFHRKSVNFRGYHAVIYQIQQQRGSLLSRVEREKIFAEMQKKGFLSSSVKPESLDSVKNLLTKSSNTFSKLREKVIKPVPSWYQEYEDKIRESSKPKKYTRAEQEAALKEVLASGLFS